MSDSADNVGRRQVVVKEVGSQFTDGATFAIINGVNTGGWTFSNNGAGGTVGLSAPPHVLNKVRVFIPTATAGSTVNAFDLVLYDGNGGSDSVITPTGARVLLSPCQPVDGWNLGGIKLTHTHGKLGYRVNKYGGGTDIMFIQAEYDYA